MAYQLRAIGDEFNATVLRRAVRGGTELGLFKMMIFTSDHFRFFGD